MNIQGHLRSLYIHIPFCTSKCIYCDFNSITIKPEIVDEYLLAIESELQSVNKGYLFKTVYIGGGTPTVLND
jgi:oxygen-independent coproporphyrinogen III oxidase